MLSGLRTIAYRQRMAAERAEALLLHAEQSLTSASSEDDDYHESERYNNTDSNDTAMWRPNLQSYWLVLEAWSRAGNPYRANDLLRRMSVQASTGAGVVPDTKCYNLVLRAWTQPNAMGGKHLQKRIKGAKSLLEEMTSYHREQSNPFLAQVNDPTIECATATASAASGSCPPPPPDRISFNTVLRVYSQMAAENDSHNGNNHNRNAKEAADQCRALLQGMMTFQRDTQGQFPDAAPDVYTFNAVLDTVANCGGNGGGGADSLSSAQQAEDILAKMIEYARQLDKEQQEEHNSNNISGSRLNQTTESESAPASTSTYTSSPASPSRSGVMISAKPNVVTYNIVLKAYNRISDVDARAPQRAQELLQRMLNLYEAGDATVKPDVISYSTVLDCWSRVAGASSNGGGMSGKHSHSHSAPPLVADAPQRAEALLNKLLDLSDKSNDNEGDDNEDNWLSYTIPNTACFNAVVKAYAQCANQEDGVEKAEALVERMHDLYATQANVHVCPNPITYTTLFTAYGREGYKLNARYSNPTKSKSYLPMDDTHNSTEHTHKKPTAKEKVDALLEKMQTLAQSGDGLMSFLKPNTVTYTSIMDAITKTNVPGFEETAESILTNMENMYNDGKGDVHVAPNTRTYTAVIHAYAMSGRADAAQRADDILMRMQQAYRRGNPHCQPTSRVFNTIINAHAKSPNVAEGARKALVLMEKMQDMSNQRGGDKAVAPDTVTFNSVMTVLSKVGSEESAKQAQTLLHILEQQQHTFVYNRNCGPSVRSYGAALQAWANVETPEGAAQAQAMLDRMQIQQQIGDDEGDLQQNQQQQQVRPNTVCVNVVLSAWARSGHPEQAHKAHALFEQLCEGKILGENGMPVQPDVVSFNAALYACTHSHVGRNEEDYLTSDERRKSMRIALSIMKVLEESIQDTNAVNTSTNTGSDSVTTSSDSEARQNIRFNIQINQFIYATFFKVCLRLLRDNDNGKDGNGRERNKIMGGFFQQCCNRGMVDESVLSSIILGAPRIFDDTCRNQRSLQKLPKEWTRNATSIKTRVSSSSSSRNSKHDAGRQQQRRRSNNNSNPRQSNSSTNSRYNNDDGQHRPSSQPRQQPQQRQRQQPNRTQRQHHGRQDKVSGNIIQS
jgi:hypothetical protein